MTEYPHVLAMVVIAALLVLHGPIIEGIFLVIYHFKKWRLKRAIKATERSTTMLIRWAKFWRAIAAKKAAQQAETFNPPNPRKSAMWECLVLACDLFIQDAEEELEKGRELKGRIS